MLTYMLLSNRARRSGIHRHRGTKPLHEVAARTQRSCRGESCDGAGADLGKNTMALTKDFRETIRERARQEPKFRQALLREAIELMISGDEKTGLRTGSPADLRSCSIVISLYQTCLSRNLQLMITYMLL